MKKTHISALGYGLAMLAAAAVVAWPVSVSAESMDTPTSSEERNAPDRTHAEIAEQRRAQAAERVEAARDTARTKLSETKLKVCQNREKAISGIMNRMSDRGQRVIDVFTKISERAQAFYERQGNVLATYESLVAEVNTKKAAAQAALEELDNVAAFSCENEDPKGLIAAFKDKLHARHQALHEYRLAIKDLIVGIRSVQPSAETQRSGQ